MGIQEAGYITSRVKSKERTDIALLICSLPPIYVTGNKLNAICNNYNNYKRGRCNYRRKIITSY